MFQVLEDNQVTLSTMKASRFVKAFENEVFIYSAPFAELHALL
jgi:hypothetical protein